MEKAKMKSKAERRELTPQADEYHYIVGWSEEDRAFVGRVAEFESLAAHGRTLEAALREIKAVLQAVLEDLA
jgi:predicted RNase H-like HicB family nuclease